MFFVQLTPTRDWTSELLDALRQRDVAVFGHSTPGQTRTPNEGNGTPKRNLFPGISLYMHLGSASRIVEQRRIADRGAAEAAAQQQQHSSSSTAAAAQQQQHSSSDGGDVKLLFLVPPPRGKPERQMKKMEPKRDILSGLSAYYALRISIANSRSSSTAAVVAATSRLRTKRTSVDTPVSLFFSFLRFHAI